MDKNLPNKALPAPSRVNSDSQAYQNWRSHQGRHGRRIVVSRVRSLTSETPCFVPLTRKNSHSGSFFFVNYQLRIAQSVCI